MPAPVAAVGYLLARDAGPRGVPVRTPVPGLSLPHGRGELTAPNLVPGGR
jgi:hypothetical protein